jgi:hypothetical protein
VKPTNIVADVTGGAMTVMLPRPNAATAKLYTPTKPLCIVARDQGCTVVGLRANGDPLTVRDTLTLGTRERLELFVDWQPAAEMGRRRFLWVVVPRKAGAR